MNIQDQIILFYKKIRQDPTNSSLGSTEAVEYINIRRRSEAVETKFYDVTDKITASGGETYFTLLDTFLDLQDARDCVMRNGKPVTIKSLADWASETSDGVIPGVIAFGVNDGGWGMIHGNTFYIYPAAVSGDAFVFWGAAEPPALVGVSGGDMYLNNIQAELTVLGAAMDALEDLQEPIGELLVSTYKSLKKIVAKRAKPRGPRLENPPDDC